MSILTVLPPVFVVTLAILIILCFLRAILCPRFVDRILAAHFAMTLSALLMAVLAFRSERGGVLALTGCVCVAASYLFTLISSNSESVSAKSPEPEPEPKPKSECESQKRGEAS